MIQRSGNPVVLVILSMVCLVTACTPVEQPSESAEATADGTAGLVRSGTELQPASVLIGHRVADYGAWKAVFDDHLEARKDASCLGHYLKRGLDDPDRVYVYCLAGDVDRLRDFLDSADLARVMQEAGVQGVPEITLMKPMSRDLVPAERLPGIIVLHRVVDYDAWRVAYDALGDFRRKHGIVGHAVSQAYDNPNDLVVYHQARNVTDLRAFVDSAEFAETMRRGGVVGDPGIRFIQVVDFASY